jgi:hypothetical protein
MQDLSKLKIEELTPLTPDVISRQATINIGALLVLLEAKQAAKVQRARENVLHTPARRFKPCWIVLLLIASQIASPCGTTCPFWRDGYAHAQASLLPSRSSGKGPSVMQRSYTTLARPSGRCGTSSQCSCTQVPSAMLLTGSRQS